jgi:excalibur calcium-binding domain-containing protein/SH3 domain-containing protein
VGQLSRCAALVAACAATVAVYGSAANAAVASETATVTQDANLRAAPTTSSAVLDELAAGETVEVVCWTTGEPTFGTDRYGSMWLQTADYGFVHSFLVSPVDVGVCDGAPAEAAPTAPLGDGPGVGLGLGIAAVPGRVVGAPGVWYDDCQHAVAAKAAPVLAWDPGYRDDLDADQDGIGCEYHPEWY